MKRLLAFMIMSGILITPVFSQEIVGGWNGKLKVGGMSLNLIFKIKQAGDSYSSTMDSPNQGAKDIPMTNTYFRNDSLEIRSAELGATFKGVLKEEIIEGTFTQMGQTFPLTLSKEQSEEKGRPQNPKAPYPYNAEEVRFSNSLAGITLAGTLTYPKEGSKFPAAILISGSGPQNRDEELMGHRPFLVLSDYLTRQGIAVLRYDDRGTAESEGNYSTASIQDFATDALAALSYLKSRSDIDSKKIGLIGHSEGGLIAFLLAADHTDVSYIVSLAGSSIKGDSLMKLQRQALFTAMGASKEAIEENEKLANKALQIVNRYTADAVFADPDKYVDELIPAALKEDPKMRQTYETILIQVSSPEMHSFINTDPAEALTRITSPVLALNGEKDFQVDADANLGQLEKLIKSKVVTKRYPGLNHLFQHCNTGLLNEYEELEETMSPEVLNDIAKWILEVTE